MTNKGSCSSWPYKTVHLLIFVTCYAASFTIHAAPEHPDKVFSDDPITESRSRRASSFVRIGRPSNFVRIGKAAELNGELEQESQPKAEDFARELNKKASSFVRIGRASFAPLHRFIRIGRSQQTEDSNNEEKRASSFVRIGKSDSNYADDGMEPSYDDEMKRASHFVRIGKSHFVRIGKAPSNFVRIGRNPSSFVRIGKSDMDENESLSEKRASNFVRIGRAPSSFVRIGRNPSSFVRIGRAPSSFVRIGRNPSSFVRIGKSDVDDYDRYNPDKRVSSFVRIGKSTELDTDNPYGYDTSIPLQEDKRASHFVRIGRSSGKVALADKDGVKKRASAFVRIGKSQHNDENIDDNSLPNDKRASSFVRIGKSFPETMSPSDISSESLFTSSPSFSSQASYFNQLGSTSDRGRDDPISVENRASHGFVRIGRAQNSPSADSSLRKWLAIRRSLGLKKSSFVRIGK